MAPIDDRIGIPGYGCDHHRNRHILLPSNRREHQPGAFIQPSNQSLRVSAPIGGLVPIHQHTRQVDARVIVFKMLRYSDQVKRLSSVTVSPARALPCHPNPYMPELNQPNSRRVRDICQTIESDQGTFMCHLVNASHPPLNQFAHRIPGLFLRHQ